MMWRLHARSTAAARSLQPSFSRMLLTCVFTVFSLRKRSTALSACCVSSPTRPPRHAHPPPAGDCSEGAGDLLTGRVLEQVAERARLERGKDVVLVEICGEDDHSRLGVA